MTGDGHRQTVGVTNITAAQVLGDKEDRSPVTNLHPVKGPPDNHAKTS